MKTRIASSAFLATALLWLCHPALALDDSKGARPQPSQNAAAQTGVAAAVAMLNSVKAQYAEAVTTLLDNKDTPGAAKLFAKMEPNAKRVVALLKGTEVEKEATAALAQFAKLREAVEAGDTDRAKEIMEQLGQIAGTVEPRVRALAENETAPRKVTRLDHVELTASGISDAYAKAIAQTVEAARAVALEQFGFNMPQIIYVSAVASPSHTTRLFNDGEDHINLSVPAEDKLQRPAVTGVFHLYGLCHEVGHLAMYRLIHKRGWLSSVGAEGWAHYAGSRILDAVYAREGEKLWPDTYSYLEDGTARLRKQLAASKPNQTTQAAGIWLALGEIIGDKGFSRLFSAWGQLGVDDSQPEVELSKALLVQGHKDKLAEWWKQAQPVLIVASAKSDFAARSKDASDLKTPSAELAKDDGVSGGKLSVSGSGHAVHFTAPAKDSYLTAVRLFGSRYGRSQAPQENAFVWLCDIHFKKIAEFPFPYSTFEPGEAKWVTIPVKPCLVPPEFVVCVGFNPTGTKGVYVHHDDGGSGTSYLAVPGGRSRPFAKGDWMIRAVLQEAKD